jgi:hypothetical protein
MSRMWTSHRGDPDRPPPTPEQIERWRRRTQAPDNELPGGAAIDTLLGRTEDAAVGITQLEAFSTGFRFTIAVRVRRLPPGLAHGGLFMLISGHGRTGVDVPLENRLLLGVEYANGDRASNLEDMRLPGQETEDDERRLILSHHGGGGGDLTVDQSYWVSPLPPEGPVTFVLSWPGFGMPESRTEIDSAPIRAAAAQSVQLWPEQPGYEPPEPPPPPRPSTGWFSYPD